MFGAERSGAEWSGVRSGAKFVGFFCCGEASEMSLLPVVPGQVVSMSRSFFWSLLAIGEPGAKGWISSCRATTESYIIEL